MSEESQYWEVGRNVFPKSILGLLCFMRDTNWQEDWQVHVMYHTQPSLKPHVHCDPLPMDHLSEWEFILIFQLTHSNKS